MMKSGAMPTHRSQKKCDKARKNTGSFPSLRFMPEKIASSANQSITIDETGSSSDGMMPN
ncbi:hypothetical protein DEH81_01655 [Pectobacterium zantedeschiae]|uniref:Uncharacterized protein n=1 Tax=Pectobacterium zantedeschiae TaxID=2034769 RepID=A0A9X8JLM8_9GAMM|nr:hypothetical protein CTN06_20760 [Pectobacterium zantedeschiae]RYC42587.1 hypothetical protein CTN06_14800 [Pectobacterium zantedeschiae]RYC45825.1 hypothetical protein CLR69_12930 [Pectobacterium zantedeschiae]RYC47120.1 hypothetical protein DEH81_01655 [Pectobacterium zantedeschiae]